MDEATRALRCQRCGEDRQIDVVMTGTKTEAYCATCGHTWTMPKGGREADGR